SDARQGRTYWPSLRPIGVIETNDFIAAIAPRTIAEASHVHSREQTVKRDTFARFALVLAVTAATIGADVTAQTAAAGSVTFNRDVVPILQKNCQTCHRPGQIAPMSFLTYNDARPWARAIKNAVVAKTMPPWFADPNFGHLINERRLSQSDIDTIPKL